MERKDIFDFSQYHWWNYWASFYKYSRDFYAGKLLNRTIDRQRYSPKVIKEDTLLKEKQNFFIVMTNLTLNSWMVYDMLEITKRVSLLIQYI